MLKLNSRPCKIGPSINSRSEMHGEDSVPAMDIPLSGIMLSREELNILLGEKLAWESLYNERTDGLPEPLLKNIKPIALKGAFEGSDVLLTLGLQAIEVDLAEVKLSKLKLEPCVGGLTSLSLTVQCPISDESDPLFHFMNRDAEVEIFSGEAVKVDPKQPELPLSLETPADDEEEGEEAAKPKARKARKPKAQRAPPKPRHKGNRATVN